MQFQIFTLTMNNTKTLFAFKLILASDRFCCVTCEWRDRKICDAYTRHYGIKVSTHWGRVTHRCVSNQTIIGSDNGLSPCRRQAIIWSNAGILLIRTLGTNFSEMVSKFMNFHSRKIRFKMSSVKWRQVCLGLNVLKTLLVSMNDDC